MEYQDFIENLLEQAAVLATKQFGKVKAWVKDGDNQTILTEADLAVGKLITSSIQAKYSDHNLIDEEAGVVDKKSRYTWVIDPIDGTSNFAAGSPLYGIMIGLLDNNIPVAGGFALPSLNKIYSASKGNGAFCNGVRIAVTGETELKKVLVAVGMHAKTQSDADTVGQFVSLLIRQVLNLRSSASTFDMAMVAEGTYGAFTSTRGMIWDCVGPHVVIEEAGGIFTHYDGSPIDYSRPLEKSGLQFSYFMANPSLHRQIKTILESM